jgi:hypothetical protein
MKTIVLAFAMLITPFATFASDACDYQKMIDEVQFMKSSSYWQAQEKDFINMMLKEYPRGCGPMPTAPDSGLDIFMDDLEFVVSGMQSPMLPRSGIFGPKHDMSSNDIHYYTADEDYIFQPGVSEVRISTQAGYAVLYVKSCSPKVVLANLLAYAPYALTASCGSTAQGGPTVEKQINDEIARILANEPK